MAGRKRSSGSVGGYIVKRDGKWRVTDGANKILGKCVRTGVQRRAPGSRGSWISSTTESFRCEIDGKQYVGRNGGEGLNISLRPSKRDVSVRFDGLKRKAPKRRR